MNMFRYFLGTRKKQRRFIVLCIILAIGGYVYWIVNEWLVRGTGVPVGRQQRMEKQQNPTNLPSYLYSIRRWIKPGRLAPGIITLGESTTSSEAEFKSTRIRTPMITQVKKPTTIESVVTTLGQGSQILTRRSKKTKRKPVPPKSLKPVILDASRSQTVSYNVHIFYYPWYGNPDVDGRYIHWNHKYLPHWNREIAKNYRKGVHVPPNDIGSDFYPELGCYSSSDPKTITEHMRQIRTSGAGVVVVSWYPKGAADDQGIPVDNLIPRILDIAEKFKLKITLHIEPYKGRNDRTVRDDVVYITKKYSNHPAFYKYKTKDNRFLPLLYIYDSYHTKPENWANLLKRDGSRTIRDTPYDCVMIALMVDSNHQAFIEVGGFDGFYTYFAVDGFTYGSTWKTWSNLKAFAEQSNSIFIPSVGPGYVDTRIRPWNAVNTRSRLGGEYYKRSFQAALSVHPQLISITSFNEWHEGTQIEKAVPKSTWGFKYEDYSPHESDYYLKLTRQHVEIFQNAS